MLMTYADLPLQFFTAQELFNLTTGPHFGLSYGQPVNFSLFHV